MKRLAHTFLAILIASMFAETSFASADATCLIYKPIDMRNEGRVIKVPTEGYIILAVPHSMPFSLPERPYSSISLPYVTVAMNRNRSGWDSNLVSRSGINIQSNCTYDGTKIKEEIVTVDLSKFLTTDLGPSLEVTAEATLECIRRTATNEYQQWRRPVLRIICKSTDKAKWKRWENAFNKQDFSKPFKRPTASQK